MAMSKVNNTTEELMLAGRLFTTKLPYYNESNNHQSKGNLGNGYILRKINIHKENDFLPYKIEGQQKSNYSQTKGNGSFHVYIQNIALTVFHILLNKNAIAKQTIPNTTLTVNGRILNFLGLFEASGTMNAAPNHPADRLTKRSERIKYNKTPVRIKKTVTDQYSLVNEELMLAGRFFTKCNIHKNKSYYKKNCTYLCCIKKLNDIHDDSFLSMLTAINIHNIPDPTYFVNNNNPGNNDILTKLGVINATPNHAADKFTNNPEKTFSHGLVKRPIIDTLIKNSSIINGYSN